MAEAASIHSDTAIQTWWKKTQGDRHSFQKWRKSGLKRSKQKAENKGVSIQDPLFWNSEAALCIILLSCSRAPEYRIESYLLSAGLVTRFTQLRNGHSSLHLSPQCSTIDLPVHQLPAGLHLSVNWLEAAPLGGSAFWRRFDGSFKTKRSPPHRPFGS